MTTRSAPSRPRSRRPPRDLAMWALTVASLAVSLLLVAPSGAFAVRSPSLRNVQGWEDLSDQEQARALRNFQKFQRLPESRRRSLERRYEHWESLAPSERDRIRQNYERYRRMSPGERHQFGERFRQWKGQRN